MTLKRTIVMIGQFASLNGLQLCFWKVVIRYSHFYIFIKKKYQTQYQIRYIILILVLSFNRSLGLINS